MEDWVLIETFRDRGSAESLALMFRAEEVPALVRACGVAGIVESAFQVLVDASLAHRARWLLAQSAVTPAELEFLATGEPPRGVMTAESVVEILELLDRASIEVWLDGGWGVDALLGEQTRSHSDLDLIVRSRDAAEVQKSLGAHGFAPKDGGTAANFVLADSLGRNVDVHAIAFDARGHGVFQLPDGRTWPFPPSAFLGRGQVGGREARCLSAEAQVQCHGQGYVPTEEDLCDMELLQARFGVVLPLHLCRQSPP